VPDADLPNQTTVDIERTLLMDSFMSRDVADQLGLTVVEGADTKFYWVQRKGTEEITHIYVTCSHTRINLRWWPHESATAVTFGILESGTKLSSQVILGMNHNRTSIVNPNEFRDLSTKITEQTKIHWPFIDESTGRSLTNPQPLSNQRTEPSKRKKQDEVSQFGLGGSSVANANM
jgi:hypothetical protein